MYGREYDGRELRFEPSGGLLYSALVMQDKESDTYWSIMTSDAIAGEQKGTQLRELPVGTKAQWRDWKRDHPDTLVLSVNGREHVQNNPYDNYFSSEAGFRDATARDTRLETKASIYAFGGGGQKYAVPFPAFQRDGAAFPAGGEQIFLYRPAGVAIFHSTVAYRSSRGFERRDSGWHELASGARFSPETGQFEGGVGSTPERLWGFDTFWYTWTLTNPGTELLGIDR